MSRIIKLVFLWIIGLLLLSYIGSFALPHKDNSGLGAKSKSKSFNFYLSLAQWDGGNYLEIAKNGYLNKKYYAFSPLYPWFLKNLAKITNVDIVLTGLITSITSFILFIYYFHKFIATISNQNEADTTVLTFIFFPTTFFCVLVYSESIFLLLIILSFYTLLKKHYLTSIIVTALAPLARFMGVFLTLANIVKFAKIDKNLALVTAFSLSILPFAAYLVILNYIFQNPLIFIEAQKSWGRFIVDPLTTIISYIISFKWFQNLSLNNAFDLATTILFLTILILNIKKLHINVWIFSILAILIPASTGTLVGMPRYALVSIGTFIIVGNFLSKRKKLRLAIWSFSLALQCILAALFITGHWIA